MEFTGKTAIVTGAGRGIGRAIAQAYARHGLTVVCCARSADQVAGTVGLIESSGGRAIAVAADIADEAQVAEIVQTAIEKTGRVDVVFNNAGSNRSLGYVWEIPSETWWGDMTTNVLGTLLMCQAVVPHMIERGNGVIVNMIGGGFDKPFPGAAAYACSKSAAFRLTDTLAAELADAAPGVLVFGFAPGLVKTVLSQGHADATRADGTKWAPGIQKMFDEGKCMQADEVGEAAVHLLTIAAPEHTGKLYQAPQRAFRG